MPREPKLSQKNGHWYTKAGNPNGEYFGKVGDVPYQEARKRFAQYMQSLGENAYIPTHFASETVEVPHVLSREELRWCKLLSVN